MRDHGTATIPGPVEGDHFVIVVGIDEDVVDVALAAAACDHCAAVVAVRREIPAKNTVSRV